MTSNEKSKSNTKREDSNQMYTENSQEKKDLTEATSKEQESESALRVACSLLLSKYLETMKDTSK